MEHGSLICSKRLLTYQGSTFLNILYLVLLLTHDQTKCWSVAQGNNSQCLPDSWIPQWVNLWMDRVFTIRRPYSFPAGKNNHSITWKSIALPHSVYVYCGKAVWGAGGNESKIDSMTWGWLIQVSTWYGCGGRYPRGPINGHIIHMCQWKYHFLSSWPMNTLLICWRTWIVLNCRSQFQRERAERARGQDHVGHQALLPRISFWRMWQRGRKGQMRAREPQLLSSRRLVGWVPLERRGCHVFDHRDIYHPRLCSDSKYER